MQERVRTQKALTAHEAKNARRLADQKAYHMRELQELEEIQQEKRKMTIEAEQVKLSQYEAEFDKVMDNCRAQLRPRKIVSD